MNKPVSRRTFLKGGAVTLLASGVSGKAASALAKTQDEQIATLIDLSRCIGCEDCVYACRNSNNHKFPEPARPFPDMYPARVPVEDWSEKRDVTDRLTPYNWLYIQRADVETKDGDAITVNIPRRCMHCVNPPCVKLCPWGAAEQHKNGSSRINDKLCLGGSKCKTVCPWQIPQRQTGTGLYLDILPSLAGNGVMYKCDRCYQKIRKGVLPACIEACPENIQTIGPRDEIIKKAYELANASGGYVYGDRENGGTNTVYVSPVPFETLNQAVETGNGMPDLSNKDDAMADGNNLAAAMFIAPFAGIAAAVGKLIYSARQKHQDKEGNG